MVVCSTKTAHDKTAEHMSLLADHLAPILTESEGVQVHLMSHPLIELSVNKRWKHILHIDNLRRIIPLASGRFPVIVAIITDIHRIPQEISHGLAGPFTATLGRDVVSITVITHHTGRVALIIEPVHHPGIFCLSIRMHRTLLLCIPVPAIRHPGSVPLALKRTVHHDVTHTLTCELALQFSEHEDNLEHGFTNSA